MLIYLSFFFGVQSFQDLDLVFLFIFNVLCGVCVFARVCFDFPFFLWDIFFAF